MPPPMTEEELKAWLFDELMGEIEPDLAKKNLRQTVVSHILLEPNELEAKLAGYEKAIALFIKKFPDFLKQKLASLKEVRVQAQSVSNKTDRSTMIDLEEKISHDEQ